MAARRHERRRARRAAIQVLYTSEITGKSATAIAEGDDLLVEDGVFPAYALDLVRGIEAHQSEIDGRLSATSENWSLERMPSTDRSILRLAVYEMLYVEDVPISVSINEAVELAKEFGGEDDSPRFVNGVLGRIARQLEGKEEPQEEEPSVNAVETDEDAMAAGAPEAEAPAVETSAADVAEEGAAAELGAEAEAEAVVEAEAEAADLDVPDAIEES